MPRLTLLIFALCSVCGCADPQLLEVGVGTLASPAASANRTYIVASGDKRVARGDPQFQEYARYLRRVLDAHGFVRANPPKEANVAIVLSYGILAQQTSKPMAYVYIAAYDFVKLRHTGKLTRLWRTFMISRTPVFSGNLRRVFPILLGAAAPFIATNRQKVIDVEIRESAKIVQVIKGLATK